MSDKLEDNKLHLINIKTNNGEFALAGKVSDDYKIISGVKNIMELANIAISKLKSLEAVANELGLGEIVNIEELAKNGNILPIINHEDPTHIHLTGTGLTHLGSAEGRDKMHKATKENPAALTDSMRMFNMGLENGKPKAGEIGAQPEWFYKGNGHNLVELNNPLLSPSFALDGGEEPEIAGIYFIGENGSVNRLGFALANEFSDHIVEKGNYLWLAHSKLRVASIGFELITGELPNHITGKSAIRRDGKIVWEKGFLSGEDNMSHTIANLEYHHFKYDLFRVSGDFHVHFFGTATASFADGFKTIDGDVFEISADAFDFSIANELKTDSEKKIVINKL